MKVVWKEAVLAMKEEGLESAAAELENEVAEVEVESEQQV